MKIGLTYDLKSDWVFKEDDPVDANAEFDKPQTVEEIIRALEGGGHSVEKIGNAKKLLAKISDLDVDIVLNICEGNSGRNREGQVSTILEMFGVPYVGSDALTLGATLDKVLAKKLFVTEGIPTPKFFEAKNVRSFKNIPPHLSFPLFVKPRYEGTSKGLSEQSRVMDIDQLKKRVDFITQTYRQPALVEEFVRGREFTVAVLGNEKPEVMPVVQVSIDGEVYLGDQFYTFERVTSPSLRYVCPAMISDDLTKRIQAIALKVYECVGCRDLGRVDFRVDDQDNPYVLEINPLPCLGKEDVFDLFPRVLGSTYEATINKIIDIASARYNLDQKEQEVFSTD